MSMSMRRRGAAWAAVAILVAVGSLGARQVFGELMPFEIGAEVETTTLSFDVPDAAVTVGQQFDVDVVVSDVENLGAFDLTMTFDNTKLEYLGIANGAFISARDGRRRASGRRRARTARRAKRSRTYTARCTSAARRSG
jgi:hypothetical protein